MPEAFFLSTRLRSRLAVEPAVLALLVAGGASAYALRNDPGIAASPRTASAAPVALAVAYQPQAGLQAPFAGLNPARAEAAMLQVASLRLEPAAFAQSFETAFQPMTRAGASRQPLFAQVEAEAGASSAAIGAAAAPVEPAPAAEAPVPLVPAAQAVPESLPAQDLPVAAPVALISEPIAGPGPVPVAAAEAAPSAQSLPPVESVVPASVPVLAMATVPALPKAEAAPAPVAVPIETPLALPEPVKAAPAPAPERVLQLVPPETTSQPKAIASSRAPLVPVAQGRAKPLAPAAKAPLTRVKPAPAPMLQIPSRYKLVEGGVETQIGVQMYGERLGSVPLQVLGSGVPSLRLGDLLGLVKTRLAPGQYERLAASAAAEEFVSLDTLRKAGIAVRYDAARDELRLGDD